MPRYIAGSSVDRSRLSARRAAVSAFSPIRYCTVPIFDVACPAGHTTEFIGSVGQLPEARCPDCGETVERLFTVGRSNVVADSIPGGMTIENMSAEPMTFYSHSEHKAAMKRLGLVPRVRHVDGSKQTSRWI